MNANESQPPIEVRGLKKAFGSQTVLDRIDLRVDRAETLAVLGRSGTGKSVLLKLLIGLQRPDSGCRPQGCSAAGRAQASDLWMERLWARRVRKLVRKEGRDARLGTTAKG
jgi:ABC-type sugar transport system ATPase subunit